MAAVPTFSLVADVVIPIFASRDGTSTPVQRGRQAGRRGFRHGAALYEDDCLELGIGWTMQRICAIDDLRWTVDMHCSAVME